MGFLHKKIWVHTLQSLLASQDSYMDHICDCYDTVELSQFSLRHPISEMRTSHFKKAIECFQRIDCGSSSLVEPYESTLRHVAYTPLEKLEAVKSTLELITSAVSDYIEQEPGNHHSDSSVTADEMIPLLAFVIVQSNVSRIASSIYYMQYYRLARMIEGSVYSYVVTAIKSAIEFLKGDPLFILHNPNITHDSLNRTRSTSLGSNNGIKQKQHLPIHYRTQHRKTQSADLYNLITHTIESPFGTDDDDDNNNSSSNMTDEEDLYNSSNTSSHSNSRRNSAILRPYMVLPRHHEDRKSLDIPHDWLTPQPQPQTQQTNKSMIPTRTLAATKPMIQTTFPKISNSTPLSVEQEDETIPPIHSILEVPKLGRSLSASTVVKGHQKKSTPPTVINLRDRVSFDGMQRPASICLDTRSLHSIEDGAEDQEELMGDFLMGLSKLDGDVVGGRSGYFKTFKRP